MTFQIGQRVMYPGFGLGRIVGLAQKAFLDTELQEFYEVVGEHSTVWVQVSEAAARGLRRLTRQDELPHLRSLLRGPPAALSLDARLRHRTTQERFKRGRLQDLCEIVRDLSGHSWRQTLSEYDWLDFHKSQRWLCEEWAAADSILLAQAETEVSALLREARLEYEHTTTALD